MSDPALVVVSVRSSDCLCGEEEVSGQEAHIPCFAMLVCGLEQGGVCLCTSKTRFTKGHSRFVWEEKFVYMIGSSLS